MLLLLAPSPGSASPLITLLEQAPEVFERKILPHLDSTDRNVISRVSSRCKDAALPLGMCWVCRGGAVQVCVCGTNKLS
jgi:hypothetical protein